MVQHSRWGYHALGHCCRYFYMLTTVRCSNERLSADWQVYSRFLSGPTSHQKSRGRETSLVSINRRCCRYDQIYNIPAEHIKWLALRHNIAFHVLSDTMHYINLKSLFQLVSVLIWIARIQNCISTNSFGVPHGKRNCKWQDDMPTIWGKRFGHLLGWVEPLYQSIATG